MLAFGDVPLWNIYWDFIAVSRVSTDVCRRYRSCEQEIRVTGSEHKKSIDSRVGGENLCLSQCGYPSWRCSLVPT